MKLLVAYNPRPPGAPQTFAEWHAQNDCDHGHCPYDCEHPQPFLMNDGIAYCGRCSFKDGVLTRMVPCTPTTCADA